MKNKKKIAEDRKKYNQTSHARYYDYRYSAKARGFAFDLSEAEFISIISSLCHYCGSNQYIGVDRKENNIGYSKENCVPCCFPCNRMKFTMSYVDFIEKCAIIAKNTRGGEA